MAQIFTHVAKILGHHYTKHHRVETPMLYGSYLKTVPTRRHRTTTDAHHYIWRHILGKSLLYKSYSSMARLYMCGILMAGPHSIVHRRNNILTSWTSYWGTDATPTNNTTRPESPSI